MQITRSISSLLFFCLVLASCSEGEKNSGNTDASKDAKTSTVSNEVNAVVALQAVGESNATGTVTFTEANGIVTMNAQFEGLMPGKHAVHIHENGDCSASDGSSAGRHWNPTNENHGEWGIEPFHRGDIGNVTIKENGVGVIGRATELWCIGCGDPTKDILGRAIIVHAGPDDFSSQPSGAAGSRVACGVIEKE